MPRKAPTREETVSDQHASPSSRGRRWFFAALLILVTLATAAGLALARTRDADAGTGPDPGTSYSFAP
ncbi:hypothetical protein Aph02nite_82870 [Actinoplanes philippinensis]|nr:hypothetical protein Aph02nite_82870 [Actinoplanes philippinensis]